MFFCLIRKKALWEATPFYLLDIIFACDAWNNCRQCATMSQHAKDDRTEISGKLEVLDNITNLLN